jgi:hypothetical protein
MRFTNGLVVKGSGEVIVCFVKQFEMCIFLSARVAELVDALDLGSSVLRRESSSLSSRTISTVCYVSGTDAAFEVKGDDLYVIFLLRFLAELLFVHVFLKLLISFRFICLYLVVESRP